MRLAWLCYSIKYEEDDIQDITVKFTEPNEYLYDKVVKVVIAELTDEEKTI